MTLRRLSLALMLGAALGGGLAAEGVKPAALTLTISGLRDGRGVLRVALFDRAAGFPGDAAKAVAHQDLTLAGRAPRSPLTVTFAGLKAGRYAVAVLHDRRGTGRMETDFLGRPKDEWGTSNNPHPLFRAPRFSEAQVTLGAEETKVLAIVLRR